MKVIKKINNNVAVCIDNNHKELIAFGKGIGFPEIPYELKDLTLVDRTFYGVDNQYYGLLNEIDEEIFQICTEIVDEARNKLSGKLNENLLFTLADHISFSIQRMKKGIEIRLPLNYELEHLYTKEVEIGRYALKIIRKKMHVYLSDNEVYSIALHIINAQEQPIEAFANDSEKIILEVTNIIEKSYDTVISKECFNYSRFVSHMQYLLKRKDENTSIISENLVLFESMKGEFPNSYACAMNIQEYFEEELDWHTSNEEILYLMLHINRLCIREDCNQ